MSGRKSSRWDSEDKVNLFIGICVALMCAFSFYSGGELLGLVTVLLSLAVAYKIVRHSFKELYLEKLF
ncbi:MAG: hypothetical protein V1703_04860, partial [Candidatus Altiarchaeota archaeon]